MSALSFAFFLKLTVWVLAIICASYIGQLINDGEGCVYYPDSRNAAMRYSLGISATVISINSLYFLYTIVFLIHFRDRDALKNTVCVSLEPALTGLFSIFELGSTLALCSLLKEKCTTKFSVVLVLKLVIVLLMSLFTAIYLRLGALKNFATLGIFGCLSKNDLICLPFCVTFGFVVYACIVFDGYREGKCVYGGENSACVFSVYLGLLATVIGFTLACVGWFINWFKYIAISRLFGFGLSIASLMCFCFSFSAYNWQTGGSGDHFTVSAFVALAFQFLSFVLWTLYSVIELFYWLMGKRGRMRTGDENLSSGYMKVCRPEESRRVGASPVTSCDYKNLCFRYLKSLGISDKYFHPRYDSCYCPKCHSSRGDDDCYSRGVPPRWYALPKGWCRFGLRAKDPAKDWHVAFHGTTPDRVISILQSGLVAAGSVTKRGEEVLERSGHYTPTTKPYNEFDTRQIFVSPTILYAGRLEYAKCRETYFDSVSGGHYRHQVAFQVWIKPSSYNISPSTVADPRPIDINFSNSELEWSTKQKRAIRVYGLLIKLTKQ